MIVLITDKSGTREVLEAVDGIQQEGLTGSHTTVSFTRRTGGGAGRVELHDCRVELLPDDEDVR